MTSVPDTAFAGPNTTTRPAPRLLATCLTYDATGGTKSTTTGIAPCCGAIPTA
jgi:hypothetical protein